jgi:hypothetical protein
VRRWLWFLTAAALLYSAVHFVQSGVRFPLAQQNLAKFDEQTPALRDHLASGEPVQFNPRKAQYGPVFFFVVHPLMTHTTSRAALSNWLYAIQLLCVAAAFAFTLSGLRPFVPVGDWPLVAAWLAVLWLNFTPLYTILVIKSVETWELTLIAAGIWAYARGRLALAAIAVGAAAMIKMLPLMFVFYLLLTNRRLFTYACAVMFVILFVSHALYGPQMGAMYLPNIVRSASGDSFGLLWHENLSVKAAIAKMFGHLDKLDLAADRGGSTLVMTDWQMRAATRIGDIVVLIGVALYSWTMLRQTAARRTSQQLWWEWSLTTVAMLILSPNTTFEYGTLALAAISFAVVQVAVVGRIRHDGLTVASLVAALVLLGAVLPRPLLNRLTFVDLLTRWSGYAHLTPSEAYQYYCFPLLGLFLLAAAIWRMRPPAGAPSVSGSSPIDSLAS